MLSLVLLVALGAVLLSAEVVARRLRVVPPVPLVAGGVVLGFLPALRGVQLPPETVLLLFLPALLFWESLTTSLREIRSDLRTVVLMSTALVVVTAAAVAVAARASGLAWGPAWVLGAAVAPTDATAAGALTRLLPRRMVTLLRAESLVNDGTALVIYALAIGITVGGQRLSVPHAGWLFFLAYGGGALAGVVTAWLGIRMRRRLDDPMQENVAILLIPFIAYLLAEAMHASGVVAVVICGLIISQAGPRIGRAGTRQQTIAFWSFATYLLNGALFVLIGLQAQAAVRGLTSVALTQGVISVGVVAGTVIGARFGWLFTAPYVIRVLDRRPQQRQRRVGARARVVNGFAGFRGAVSLAAALAVPHTVVSGRPFPDRDLVIFVTAGVILVTLAGQALLLPVVVRWARLPPDTGVRQERHLAETTVLRDALEALPRVAAEQDAGRDVVERLRDEYEMRLQVLHVHGDEADDRAAVCFDRQDRALRLAMVAEKRHALVRLRDDDRIDDVVLRQVQSRLDMEELRLSGLS
ncbi:Na+/H+ antiporter [Actinoplanes sp. NPDC049596]|uniref:Na+/H+ antiporter n=1 Tax=unclassified Actinoplanes TaxID=2626549 RepID=UPI00341F2A45